MKYKLLKDLPFMRAGSVFDRMCKDSDECCVFGFSYHNDVKHYDTMQFSENENKILCSIIDNPEWIETIVPKKNRTLKYEDWIGENAVDAYDAGHITREELVEFIESY